jgi:hypothetical protein
MSEDIRYVAAWRRNDPKIERDAVAMWNEMRILPPNVRPEERAKELVTVAYAGERIVGITTASLQAYQPVRQRFAWGRILLRPEVEKTGLVVPLTIAMREELREWSVANPAERVAGFAIVLTAPGYGAAPVIAAGLALAGYSAEGHQIRLYWWDHFRIPV